MHIVSHIGTPGFSTHACLACTMLPNVAGIYALQPAVQIKSKKKASQRSKKKACHVGFWFCYSFWWRVCADRHWCVLRPGSKQGLVMRERVQCNCQEEWNVLCQQRVLGSLHIVGQPSIPNSYWAVLFFFIFLPMLLPFFFSLRVLMCLPVTFSLWRRSTKHDKASTLQVFL